MRPADRRPAGARRAAARRRRAGDRRQPCAGPRRPSGNSKSISHNRSCCPIWRRVRLSASGPSGVSCSGTSAAARSAAGTSTGHHTECFVDRGSAIRRRGRRRTGRRSPAPRAPGVPNFAPVGSSRHRRRDVGALGRCRRARCRGPRRRVRRPPVRCSPRTPPAPSGPDRSTRCAATRCRCCGGSAGRTDRRVGIGRESSGAGAAIAASSTTGPPAASHSREALQRLLVGHRPGRALVADQPVTGAAVPQQPRQTAVGFVLRRRPPRDDLGLRPGHRDVHQAAVVAGGFACDRVARPRGSPGCSGPPMCRHRIPLSWNRIWSGFLHVAVERERQVDDRELQALAAVHRHDLDGGGVAVETPVALGGAAAVSARRSRSQSRRAGRVKCSRWAASCSR